MESMFKYAGWFHDGSLDYVEYCPNRISFWLESFEIEPNAITDSSLKLSNHSSLRGKLHVKGIKRIRNSDTEAMPIELTSWDSGEIMDLEISSNKIHMNLIWRCNSTKKEAWAFYEIEADEVTWENLPTLKMPRYFSIEDCVLFFTNGTLLRVSNDEEGWHLYLESTPINDEDIVDFPLSQNGTLRGTFDLRYIKCISLNGKIVDEIPELCGTISMLSIGYNQLNLSIKKDDRLDILSIQAAYIRWKNFGKSKSFYIKINPLNQKN